MRKLFSWELGVNPSIHLLLFHGDGGVGGGERMKTVAEGDVVIAWAGAGHIVPIKVQRGEVFGTRFGRIQHDDMIGKPLGSRVYSRELPNKKNRKVKGHIILLEANAELYTAGAILKQTQIVYSPDISQILYELEIKPGSRVIESGTGSGSLTRSFKDCIKPTGTLYTFEFNIDRMEMVKEAFKTEPDGDCVVFHHRDVCSLGFQPLVEVDAVFLDLPNPWLAVPHAYTALRRGGRICCFSPCMEQVQRTCAVLREYCFHDIVTVEALQMQHLLEKEYRRVLDIDREDDLEEDETSIPVKGGGNMRVRSVKNRRNGYLGLNTPWHMEEAPHLHQVYEQPSHTSYLTFATRFYRKP